MPNKLSDISDGAELAAWVKRCYFAGRESMEAALRPHGLGATQWYVLHQLAVRGPTMQRELVLALNVERATLSVIVTTLVRKGLLEQMPDRVDQRQKLIRMTLTGERLWKELPDLNVIHAIAFGETSRDALATAVNVLKTATERLESFSSKGNRR